MRNANDAGSFFERPIDVPTLRRRLTADKGTPMNTIEKIIRDIAELPDRTSPDDHPDMMFVTAEELRLILEHYGVGQKDT